MAGGGLPELALLLQDMVLVSSDAEHGEHGEHDYRAVQAGDLQLCSIDGSVTRMPDTPANRAEFGSATSDEGAPYPQLRDLPVTDASTRGMLAMVTGPSGGDKAAAEQALLDRALTECSWVFTKRRLFVMDRNFPGVARIRKMITVTHVLIRLKSDISVTKTGDFLPDGSYMADIAGSGQTVRMRVIEYDVHVDGQHVPEMFCLVTDLDDWKAYPAGMLAAAYKWRWDGSETALREAKSAIRGACPSTGPIFRSRTPAMIRQEHAAWITATELVRAVARAAARRAAPARKGRRAGAAGPAAGDLLHRRPPRRHHHHPHRCRHCQPARPHHRRPLPRHPPRPGQTALHHRPGPAPRPQDQGPAAIPSRRTRHHHPQGSRHHHDLRPSRRLKLRRPATAPSPPARGTGRRSGTSSGHPARAPAAITVRKNSSQQTLRTANPKPPHLHGIGAWARC